MALRKVKKDLGCVKIISEGDSALDLDKSDLDAYREDPLGNLSKLVMLEGQEPTVFICNMELSAREKAKIDNATTGGVDDDKNVAISTGSWKNAVTRHVLKDIQNPPGEPDCIQFKKDGKGLVSDSTMDELADTGVIDQIWSAYLTLTGDRQKKREVAKK